MTTNENNTLNSSDAARRCENMQLLTQVRGTIRRKVMWQGDKNVDITHHLRAGHGCGTISMGSQVENTHQLRAGRGRGTISVGQQLGSAWLEIEGGSTDSPTANGRQRLQSAWLELKEDQQTHSLQTAGNNLDQRGSSSKEDQQTHSLRLPIQSRVYMRCERARISAASHPFLIFSVLVSSASVRATSALAGVHWAFAHGAGGVGRTVVVIGVGAGEEHAHRAHSICTYYSVKLRTPHANMRDVLVWTKSE
ncbi:hypothetical protein EDD22DRAFT_849104 [Suillus occidentalis]|nr:hypothetical protein EDD22DRAFT_849104 [Suillus occidentalis]